MMRVFQALMVVSLVGCAQKQVLPSAEVPAGMDHYLEVSKPDASQVSDTRRQLLEEAGRTIGFRGGKAERAWQLRNAMDTRFTRLELVYDFRTLISREGWLPPVITEAADIAHITPDQIRTASRVYEIIVPERFVSNPPSWRTWLFAGLSSTEAAGPDHSVLPENSVQKALWQAAVRKGWEEGRISADHTLEANFNRLTRDYRGMLLYSQLLRQGFITQPVVADQQQTVTGDRQKLMTGDRVRTIKEKAGFVPDRTQWIPVIRKDKQ